jgi:hypothetical protein
MVGALDAPFAEPMETSAGVVDPVVERGGDGGG